MEALRAFLDADPQLRGRTTVIPAPGSPRHDPGPVATAGYRLIREDEVPALMRRLRGEREPAGNPRPPGESPTALATYREERRQICAISRIVCQVTTEVLLGLRPASQLQRWLDLEVQQKVVERAALLAETRRSSRREAAGRGDRGAAGSAETIPRPQPLTFGHLRAERITRGAWEVAVVFADGKRIRACALRLEAHRRRWRVVAMELG
ncbi:Rv3235 family protein [Nesterenkonia sp. LB17]|uniref:Rv3235 family protein n=1 Tax=Nesterenkonia sp. LB17 TaxID=2901230 RepID=UPI001F4CE94F|nr:Rv3235 family protein [Nesterenkonia sp. LB17]MCH8564480.1 Rv3235 family protein [Nesterenkonia sp. LB17]